MTELGDDMAALRLDLARIDWRLRDIEYQTDLRESLAEFDRLAARAPVRSLDLLRRNAS